MPGTKARSWRFLLTPKWLGWHLIMVGTVFGMLWLGDWQLHRADSCRGLPKTVPLAVAPHFLVQAG